MQFNNPYYTYDQISSPLFKNKSTQQLCLSLDHKQKQAYLPPLARNIRLSKCNSLTNLNTKKKVIELSDGILNPYNKQESRLVQTSIFQYLDGLINKKNIKHNKTTEQNDETSYFSNTSSLQSKSIYVFNGLEKNNKHNNKIHKYQANSNQQKKSKLELKEPEKNSNIQKLLKSPIIKYKFLQSVIDEITHKISFTNFKNEDMYIKLVHNIINSHLHSLTSNFTTHGYESPPPNSTFYNYDNILLQRSLFRKLIRENKDLNKLSFIKKQSVINFLLNHENNFISFESHSNSTHNKISRNHKKNKDYLSKNISEKITDTVKNWKQKKLQKSESAHQLMSPKSLKKEKYIKFKTIKLKKQAEIYNKNTIDSNTVNSIRRESDAFQTLKSIFNLNKDSSSLFSLLNNKNNICSFFKRNNFSPKQTQRSKNVEKNENFSSGQTKTFYEHGDSSDKDSETSPHKEDLNCKVQNLISGYNDTLHNSVRKETSETQFITKSTNIKFLSLDKNQINDDTMIDDNKINSNKEPKKTNKNSKKNKKKNSKQKLKIASNARLINNIKSHIKNNNNNVSNGDLDKEGIEKKEIDDWKEMHLKSKNKKEKLVEDTYPQRRRNKRFPTQIEFEDIPLEDEKTKPLKSEGNDEETQKPKMKPMSKFLRRRRNVKPKEVKKQCIEQQVKDEEPSTLNMKRPSLKTPFFQDFLLDKNDEHKNRLLQLKLKNDINYGISKGGLSENELDLFSEFKKKINNMKNFEDESYHGLIENAFNMFQIDLEELKRSKEAENRINKFVTRLNIQRENHFQLYKELSNKAKAIDKKILSKSTLLINE